MLFQQVNKNTPERIWMVAQNFDNNQEDLVAGQLVNWQVGFITDIGKEIVGLRVTKAQRAVSPDVSSAGVVKKGSRPIQYGQMCLIQVYGFYDGAITDGSGNIPENSCVAASLTVPGTVALISPTVGGGAYQFTVGYCLIASSEYTALGLTNRVGLFLKCM